MRGEEGMGRIRCKWGGTFSLGSDGGRGAELLPTIESAERLGEGVGFGAVAKGGV